MAERLVPSRLSARNILRTAVVGVNTRRNRSIMSALGIAIGIAAIVGVLGLSNSSRSNLINQLNALGTNLIQVQPQTGIGVGNATLPTTAAGAISRIPNVQDVSQEIATGANVYRSSYVPSEYTAGLTVSAVDPNILTTLHGSLAQGQFLNAANIKYPVAVLGANAAQALGIISLQGDPTVSIGGRNFTVIGILNTFPLSPDLDSAALIGIPAAVSILGVANTPTTIDVRANPNDIDSVLGALAATANPRTPIRWPRPARPHSLRPRRRRRAPSPNCCSGWARWRCSSAAWASRTSWSSRSSSADRKLGCAAPWVRRAATSWSSSSPNH